MNSDKPPIYEPGPYPYRLLSCLPYLVPIADSFDLGKYMFEAYPETLAAYNSLFGAIAGIYNGVPFLPFAVFFLLSYIARAPTFPVETRFHASQAFMLSILQFPASVLFPIMEKAGVPGMAGCLSCRLLYFFYSATLREPLRFPLKPDSMHLKHLCYRFYNFLHLYCFQSWRKLESLVWLFYSTRCFFG